jgi:hypothetical protein
MAGPANNRRTKERHPSANATQRARRATFARVDYRPSPEALDVIRANLGGRYPLCILSGVIDRIVIEWAEETGRLMNNQRNSNERPELVDANARARMTSGAKVRKVREACGARARAGTPCRTRPLPGRCRCKWHGGASTGPKTAEGRARALANLRQFRPQSVATA